MRVFSSALRRNIGNSTLQNLKESLLNAFTADIPSYRRVFRFSGNLIYFIYIYNPALSLLYVKLGILKKLQENILYIFPDITCFSKSGCICHGKRYMKNLGKCLCQKRLSAAGWPDHKNIALCKFDVIVFGLYRKNTFVMVINRNR